MNNSPALMHTFLLLSLILGAVARADESINAWTRLGPGLEYKSVELAPKAPIGDGQLRVVRIDPNQVRLRFALAQEHAGVALTAAEWCKREGLAVAINAGMFKSDQLHNVGFLRNDKTFNNSHWNEYQSVLAFTPNSAQAFSALLLDRDIASNATKLEQYSAIVQNLRLIKTPGINVWQKQNKKWSEAAIANDKQGRILFLFSRSPFSMWEFNQRLLATDLEIQAAMHVEGGPEASLSIHSGGIDLDFAGSYETGFREDDSNQEQWVIPNVIGVENKSKP